MTKKSRELAAVSAGDNTPAKTPKKAPVKRGWDMSEMDDEQRAEAETIQARVLERPRRAKVSLEDDGDEKKKVVIGEGSEASKTLHSMRFMEATGSRSNEFANDLLRRLGETLRLTGDNSRDTEKMSGAMALIAAVAPQNELEATMALQMIAANEAVLRSFERSRKADYMEHAQGFSNMANKAMRSFALHAEAIAKLRRGGEQVVKHVHVNEGGQAVIANSVTTGGRG